MARDVVKAFLDEHIAGKALLAVALMSIIGHFCPWNKSGGFMGPDINGFEFKLGVVSFIAMLGVFGLSIATLWMDFSDIVCRNIRVMTVLAAIVALIAILVVYSRNFGTQEMGGGFISISVTFKPGVGLYLASSGAFFSLLAAGALAALKK